MRPIDADALIDDIKNHLWDWENVNGITAQTVLKQTITDIENQATVNPWHRVEDDPPDEKEDAIFYYEWTGISGTVYKETSITSLDELMALGCKPIAWMEKPEPPKEGTHENRDNP